MIRIDSPEDYRTYLMTRFADNPVGDTGEELNVSLEFVGREPLPFVDATYCETVWRVMNSYNPPGLAPSVNDLTTLDYYHKRQQGWFDGKAAKDYGAEIARHLPLVDAELKNNPQTRRGVIRMSGEKCLLSIQFLFRYAADSGVLSAELTLIANFRSSDAIHGLPVDVFWLRQLIDDVCEGANVTTRLILNIGSLHVYDRDRHLL